MEFSPQQNTALNRVSKWLDSKDSQVFYLAGFAGTGKTTLARHLAEDYETLFAAYTGKAALCMQKAGCQGASTIHKILYVPEKEKMGAIKALEAKIAEATEDVSGFVLELEELKKPKFKLNEESPIQDADLVVLDECSMIDEEMAQDALSFGTKILVLGDPMQLPPVKGTGYFTAKEPDFTLTEIHRQALDNPIIALSKLVRENGYIPIDFAPNAKRILRRSLTPEMARDATQILTGKNDTRRAWNKRMRKAYGRTDPYPVEGDKLICLKNHPELDLLNGMFADVTKTFGAPESFALNLGIHTELGKPIDELAVYSIPFQEYGDPDIGKMVPYYIQRNLQQFDYGYCITVHKAQGSQFDHVLLDDDQFLSWKPDQRRRWLYTAVTRAVESIIVV